jgi:hypothetical protein
MDDEAGPSGEKPSLSEILCDPTQPRRFTEERACANVLLDCLRARLSVLTLRLMGVPWGEVRKLMGRGAGEMRQMRQTIVETALVIWQVSIPERIGSARVDTI